MGFILGVIQAFGFEQIAGHTAVARAAFGRQMQVLGAQFSVLVPPPVHPETMGGYLSWRVTGSMAVIFSAWALASAAGAGRGDEERGLVEILLAGSLGRLRLIASRMFAFGLGCLAAALAVGAGEIAASSRTPDYIGIGGPILDALSLTALAVSVYVLTLLVSQLTNHQRTATGVAGMLLLGLYLLNALSRAFDFLLPWRVLSPYHYYDLSRPLTPGGRLDLNAVVVLLTAALVMGSAAAVAFSARDIGSPLFKLPTTVGRPTHDPSSLFVWRTGVLRGLYEQTLALTLWTVGLAALAVAFVNVTKTLVGALLAIPGLAPYFRFIGGANPAQSFLGFEWSGVAELMITAFAITQVARWASEDADGRLEETLSHPISRTAVILERAAVLALQTLVMAAVSGFVLTIAAGRQGITIDPARVAESAALLVPLALIFGGVGAIMTAAAPRPAIALLAGVVIASYFTAQLGPLFRWPEWVLDLSVFKLYGNPIGSGLDRLSTTLIVSAALTMFAASLVVMRRRDVGR